MSTCSYHGGTPTVNMVDTEFMWHAIPPMSAPWSCPIMDKQHGMECIVQPFVHFVPNGGCYRFDYTGDIGLFKTNEFSLLNTQMKLRTGRTHRPLAQKPGMAKEWGSVIEIVYTFPGKINVYWNEAFVPPKGRRNQVAMAAKPGANYMNPGSRTLAFVVKGSKPTDTIKLKLLEVVEVSLPCNVTSLVTLEEMEGNPL